MQTPYNQYGVNYNRRRSHFVFQAPESEGDLLGYGAYGETTAWPTGYSRMLREGRRGPDVKLLQARLIQLNFLPAGEDDGIFGPKTKRAVQAFQRSVGRSDSGAVGRGTLTALYPPASPSDSAGTADKVLSWLTSAQTATEYFTPRGRRRRARRQREVYEPEALPDQLPAAPAPTLPNTDELQLTAAALLDPGDSAWKKWMLAAAGGLTLLLIILMARRR